MIASSMTSKDIAKLRAAGYGVGDYGDFLGLTAAERERVELGLALTRAVRSVRERDGVTQAELAARIGSSQPRVATIESGSTGVSLDLAFKALFALGGSLEDVVKERARLRKSDRELRNRLEKAKKFGKGRAAAKA